MYRNWFHQCLYSICWHPKMSKNNAHRNYFEGHLSDWAKTMICSKLRGKIEEAEEAAYGIALHCLKEQVSQR